MTLVKVVSRCRDAKNAETVLFTMSFAFVLYGHKAEESNMTTCSARGESVDIVDKLHWCIMETSFLEHNAQLWVQSTYAHANLGWTLSAHEYGKYTENFIFSVFFGFPSARDMW